MTNEIEYIEPTQEHVGQMVEVKSAWVWLKRKLLVVLPEPQVYRFICEHAECNDEFAKWREARIARPLTYAERQAKCGLKVGDRVKFVRAWEGGESGTRINCYASMVRQIGRTGYISDECPSGLRVTFDANTFWWLPHFVLEKVDDRVATRDDIGKQVYVDGTPSDVFTIETIYGVEGDLWRAVVRSGDKRFVYELSNLRVKE